MLKKKTNFSAAVWRWLWRPETSSADRSEAAAAGEDKQRLRVTPRGQMAMSSHAHLSRPVAHTHTHAGTNLSERVKRCRKWDSGLSLRNLPFAHLDAPTYWNTSNTNLTPRRLSVTRLQFALTAALGGFHALHRPPLLEMKKHLLRLKTRSVATSHFHSASECILSSAR